MKEFFLFLLFFLSCGFTSQLSAEAIENNDEIRQYDQGFAENLADTANWKEVKLQRTGAMPPPPPSDPRQDQPTSVSEAEEGNGNGWMACLLFGVALLLLRLFGNRVRVK